MNGKDGKCFLCLEKGDIVKISVCEDCVYGLVRQKRGTCLNDVQETKKFQENNLIQLESLTNDGRIYEVPSINGICETNTNGSCFNSIHTDETSKNGKEITSVCHDSKDTTTHHNVLQGYKDLLNHMSNTLCIMGDLMDESRQKQQALNNKIQGVISSLDKNKQEIEEIKAIIHATTLQLKMLFVDQENTSTHCESYFRESPHHVIKHTSELQSALEQVNQSIAITENLLAHTHEPDRGRCCGITEDVIDVFNHLDKDSDVFNDGDLNVECSLSQDTQKVVPDNFNFVKSLEGDLGEPVDVITAPNNHVYITDYNNDRILVFDLQTGQTVDSLTHVTSTSGRQTPFLCPTGIACDNNGNLVVAERARHRVTVMDSSGNLTCKFGKMGKAQSQLRDPQGVSVDRRGRLIVADTSNSRIQVYDKTGDFIFVFGDEGEEKLDYPTYAVFHKGLFLVSDTDNDAVKIYNKYGEYLRRLSDHVEGEFSAPSGLAIYHDDYVLVCDYNNDCVKLFSLDGRFVTKFGSAGSGPGQFSGPESVAVSCDNKVIVTDKNNGRVQIFE